MSPAWLGWRDGGEFRQARAGVVDISLGGCFVLAEGEPPSRGTILIRLHGPLLPVWFEARSSGVQTFRAEVHSVRLIFSGACPYELFMAVAYGLASHDAARRPPLLPGFFGKDALGRGRGRV